MGLRILSVASEWFSYHGGLSTFNRSFCTALAAAGHEVVCLIPAVSAEELEDAKAAQVQLIPAPAIAGLSAEASLCLPITSTFQPDIVVGHGHITGAAAAARVAHFHRGARHIHFLHTLPEEIEWFKERNGTDAAQRAQRKQDVETALCRSAALAVAVGPRLERQWNTHLAGPKERIVVHRLTPGLPESPPVVDIPQSSWCLLLGRLEDMELKGVDIAAAAMGILARDDRFRGAREPTLVLRGATPNTSNRLWEEVRSQANTNILCNIKEFTHDESRVREDIARASVVLMPSRVEGFGLVALEALAMGVPILVSQRSGFGELLLERIEADASLAFAAKYVVDVCDNVATDAARWAESIRGVLDDRELAFKEMATLREVFLKSDYWNRAVNELMDLLGMGPQHQARSDTVRDNPLKLAYDFAKTDAAVSVAMSTSVLEQAMERVLVSRGIAKAGLQPAQYLALLRHKGYLKPADANFGKELIHRRNIAVHDAHADIDSNQAEEHARGVEHLVSILEKVS